MNKQSVTSWTLPWWRLTGKRSAWMDPMSSVNVGKLLFFVVKNDEKLMFSKIIRILFIKPIICLKFGMNWSDVLSKCWGLAFFNITFLYFLKHIDFFFAVKSFLWQILKNLRFLILSIYSFYTWSIFDEH